MNKSQNVLKDLDIGLLLQRLLRHNATTRLEILSKLRAVVRAGGVEFLHCNKLMIFEGFFIILSDARWEVRYHCVLLIADFLPYLGVETDACVLVVLPQLIRNLGHENLILRRSVIQVLQRYLKYTNNLQCFFRCYIQLGLESEEYSVKKGAILSLPSLLTEEYGVENLYILFESLTHLVSQGEPTLFSPTYMAIQRIRKLIGPIVFTEYLHKLEKSGNMGLRKLIEKCSNAKSSRRSETTSRNTVKIENIPNSYLSFGVSGKKLDGARIKNQSLKFGIFESSIVRNILNEDDSMRIEGVEQMKAVLKSTDELNLLQDQLTVFLSFLSSLLDDMNFNIIIAVLGVYETLVEKLKGSLKVHIKSLVLGLTKLLGYSNLVVREHCARVIHKIMHEIPPKLVLGVLLTIKNHRNPRVREAIINRITAAVLTFPSYSLDICELCEAISPLLVDNKRRVRQAALECFATMGQVMESSKLGSLITIVESMELKYDADGLMRAFQARLARRKLPRCTTNGLILYSVNIPTSAGRQGFLLPTGPDIEWILGASCSTSPSSTCKSNDDPRVVNLKQEKAEVRRYFKRKKRKPSPEYVNQALKSCYERSLSEDSGLVTKMNSSLENLHRTEPNRIKSCSYPVINNISNKQEKNVFPEKRKGTHLLKDSPIPLKPVLARTNSASHQRKIRHFKYTGQLNVENLRSVEFNKRTRRPEPLKCGYNVDCERKVNHSKEKNEILMLPFATNHDISVEKLQRSQVIHPELVHQERRKQFPVSEASIEWKEQLPKLQDHQPHKTVKQTTVAKKKPFLTSPTTKRNIPSSNEQYQVLNNVHQNVAGPPNQEHQPSNAGDQKTGGGGGHSEYDNISKNPEKALREILNSISDENWTKQVEAMKNLDHLASFHSSVVHCHLHSVVLAVIREIQNLRTSVARVAIATLANLFINLKRQMETDLNLIIKSLLHKYGENVGFIREDIEKALDRIMENASLQKVALAVIGGGSIHRNAAVRKLAAEVLSKAVDEIGPGRLITYHKEVAEQICFAAAEFVVDATPLARYFGRKIYESLMSQPQFDKMLQKCLPFSTLKNIESILDTIKTKGIGEKPKESVSATLKK
ncbi:TOG array regulator of axonemal microtubules protein 1-like isoform X2 [Limulus polyphemus]|uniref:TOG array regulator of axonemal microtubules protein 1-like isoform X2 n=1 Tax=Limulus polyphemus TaxID=6850 RepID=A0ABM1SQN2_LIMPO|nr:TOG array regulator of axonemal microtubules protein 1-like isoform X2 [Limulus polyphemus]